MSSDGYSHCELCGCHHGDTIGCDELAAIREAEYQAYGSPYDAGGTMDVDHDDNCAMCMDPRGGIAR